MVCDGDDSSFYEYDEGGSIVWEYKSPVSIFGPNEQGSQILGWTFKIERLAPDDIRLDGKNLTPQGPIELNPLDSDCEIYDQMISVEDLDQGIELIDFPNPLSGNLNIDGSYEDVLMLEIIDIQGRLIHMNRSFRLPYTVSRDELSNGFHFIRLRDRTGQLVVLKKLVVLK